MGLKNIGTMKKGNRREDDLFLVFELSLPNIYLFVMS